MNSQTKTLFPLVIDDRTFKQTMSATQANIDSGLSGKPSDDIDKQKGPATGSNVESPGGTFGAIGSQAQTGSNAGGQNNANKNTTGGSH